MAGVDPNKRITTEVVQLFSPQQAWDYMLVPVEWINERVLLCYAESQRNYDDVIQELAVLYNAQAKLEHISSDELNRLLCQYYRKDGVSTNTPAKTISEISQGQGFLLGLIEEAFDCYASDIHIEAYEQRCRIRFRIDGRLLERYVVGKSNYASLTNQIKILSNLDISEKRLPQDGRILFDRDGKKFDVRVSSLPTIYGEKIVLRLLTRHIELLELTNLGFSAKQLEDYCSSIRKPYGLVLICGPTGSGKSTTLYATLRLLNEISDNILTIEDPIEYTLEGVNQVQLKEDIGLTFTSALRTFLRQDPDIIMVGEIRDAETAQMAIRSSLTGHMIFSTIHTNSAWGSIARLSDMGIHPYLIANTLTMCVSQRLVRMLCPHCKQETEITDDVRIIVGDSDIKRHYVATGCDKCYYTGYSGRKAIYEVIPMDDELSIAARNSEVNIDDLLKKRNIITLKQAGIELFHNGNTSLEELIPIIKD